MKTIKNFGVGTDIENIDRFEVLDTVEHRHFLENIFTKKELYYCFSKQKPAPHLAVRYSAKEAILKALSSMGKNTINYNKIEILNNDRGVPIAQIPDKTLNNLQIFISLSHCNNKALAFVVITEVEKNEGE